MKKLRKTGAIIAILGLLILAIRGLALEFFAIPTENNFVAPAGEMINPDVSDFSFVVVSDTGAKNAPIEKIVKNAEDAGYKFIIHLGDLVRYRNPSHFRWIVSEIDEKQNKIPFYMIPGNHEIETRLGNTSKSMYKSVFGSLYYWFSYGDVLFVALDSSEGEYSKRQLLWLEDIMKKIRPNYKYCIVLTHMPPIALDEWQKSINITQSHAKLQEILTQYKVDLLLSGHIHQYWQGKIWGIPAVTLMSSGQKSRSEDNRHGYLGVDISKDGVAKITPNYLEDNLEDDNEDFELLFSNILVDARSLFIGVVLFVFGIIFMLIGFIYNKCRSF